MSFFCVVWAVVVRLAAVQQSPPSAQHAVFAAIVAETVVTLAVGRQFGGQSSEQPDGQVGSKQQSNALAEVGLKGGIAALAVWYSPNETAATRSGNAARADHNSFRFIILPS